MVVMECFDPSMYCRVIVSEAFNPSVGDAPLQNNVIEILKGCGGALLARTEGMIAELDMALTEDPRVVCSWGEEHKWMMPNDNFSHKIVMWKGDMGRDRWCGDAMIMVNTRYNCLYIMWKDAKGGGMNTELLAGRWSLEGASIDGDTRTGKDGARFNKPLAILQAGKNSFYVGEGSCVRLLEIDEGLCVVTTLAGGPTPGLEDSSLGRGALLQRAVPVFLDGGSLFFVDEFNQALRRVSLMDGCVSTVAGKTEESDSPFSDPVDALKFGDGFLVLDRNAGTVFRVDRGVATAIAGGRNNTQKEGVGGAVKIETPIAMVMCEKSKRIIVIGQFAKKEVTVIEYHGYSKIWK